MKQRAFRVGVFQIAGHPAVKVADHDFLQEPYTPNSRDVSYALLGRHGFEVRASLESIGKEYLAWAAARLAALLAWIESRSVPDYLVFPECSIPFELLGQLREFAGRTGCAVFAGTHTPFTLHDASKLYRSVGVRKGTVERVLGDSPSAVLPIITEKETFLHPKAAPSIFERTDLVKPSSVIVQIKGMTVGRPRIRVAPLICAEALRLPSFQEQVDLVVVSSLERQPQRYQPFIASMVANKIPVVFANDAEFGGSGIFTAIDDRAGGWWFESPMNGRLSVGEYYLEVELDLSATAVEVGVSNPGKPASLVRVVPILGEGDAGVALEEAARSALDTANEAHLTASVKTLVERGGMRSTQVARWILLESLVRNGNLTPEWKPMVGDRIQTAGVASLGGVERRLCAIADSCLSGLSDGALAAVTDGAAGQLLRVRAKLKERLGSGERRATTGATNIQATVLPVDRTDVIEAVRQFATHGSAILIVAGLQAVGKTTAIAAGLAQSHVRVLRITCGSATGADFLYEYILKAAGRTPVGTVPRQDFPQADLVDALRGVDVLFVEDAHNLLDESRTWRTRAIEKLLEVLIESLRQSKLRLLFETRRHLPLPAPLGVQVVPRRVPGLPHRDGRAFLEQQLRRAGLNPESVPEAEQQAIVRYVDGHPGMLILCADACARHSSETVIRDLKSRTGLYLSAVRKLISHLGLSAEARSCLAALLHTRTAVSPAALEHLVGDKYGLALSELLSACLVERDDDGAVSVAALLDGASEEVVDLAGVDLQRFHKGAATYFTARATDEDSLAAYTARFAANYHAALAGLPLPFDVSGVLDSLTAAAEEESWNEHYDRVARLLEPVARGKSKEELRKLPEDLLRLLARAYAWTDRFDDAFKIADAVSRRNKSYVTIFTDACAAALRSHKTEIAERALSYADKLDAGHYKVHELRGKILRQRNDYDGALAQFRLATERAQGDDAWPWFFLSDLLVRLGRPKEALEALAEVRKLIDECGWRVSRNLSKALLSNELIALVLTGEHEEARVRLEALESTDEKRPELIVCAAYVRAFLDGGGIDAFEEALATLSRKQETGAHKRAQIAMFKGKLLERKGDLRRAGTELEEACRLDKYNLHMKVCLLRVLLADARRETVEDNERAAIAAAERASEVVRDILSLDPGQKDALSAQEDLYTEFQVH